MRHLAASACFCFALLFMAVSALHAPAAEAAPAAPAASTADPDDAADDAADDESDAAEDAAEQELGNCATLGEAVRRFALARDKGLAKMDAFKDVTRGKSAYVAGSLLDQTLQWPYDHPAEQPITTSSHFYHRCVLDAMDSLDPATEDQLNKLSLSCQKQHAADPDAIDDCIAATTDAIVDRYHGNAPPAVTRTPASAFTPFAFIAETPLIAAAPKPGARAKPVAAPPKAVIPLEATPAVASTPVFTQPQAAPLLAAAPSPAASMAQVTAPPEPPLEETPASASAVVFTQSEAVPLLAAVPSPAIAALAPVQAPIVPLEETPATASAPAYAQPESAALLAATAAPAVSPPLEVAPPPAPVLPQLPAPQPVAAPAPVVPQPAPQQVAVAAPVPAPAPAPVAAVVAVATPPVEVAAPAPAAKATREITVAGTGPAGVEEYGKLKLGMPLTDAIKTFHSYPDIEKDEQGADTYVFLVADGAAFITLRTSPTHPGELYGIQVTGGPEAKQAPLVGVLLGDTASDLLAKLGEPAARTPVKDYHTLWSYTGRNYSFEVSDGGDVISLLIYGYAGTPEQESLGQDGAQGHTGGVGF